MLGFLLPQYFMARIYEWDIPANANVLFMGASHVVHGIDDSLLPQAINIAKGSERYLFTYLKLIRILENKNNNIRHIILECAPTDLSIVADQKIFSVNNEMLLYIPLYYLYFKPPEWEIYSNYKYEIGKILSQNFYKNWAFSAKKYFSRYGGYEPRREIFNGEIICDEANRIDAVYYGNQINIQYLKKIITICESYNISLILLYCPVYKPELYYNQEYYYSILEKEFKDIEYWNYSDLDIPFKFRMDPHHLNKDGAKYFTEIIGRRLESIYSFSP
jgi:hypothetical protein